MLFSCKLGHLKHLRKFAIVLIYSLLYKISAPKKIGCILTNIMSDVSAWQALQYSGQTYCRWCKVCMFEKVSAVHTHTKTGASDQTARIPNSIWQYLRNRAWCHRSAGVETTGKNSTIQQQMTHFQKNAEFSKKKPPFQEYPHIQKNAPFSKKVPYFHWAWP